MPHRAFIGIGSNLGDRAGNYREAIQKIAAIPGTRVVRQSSIYETEPVGDELMLKWPFLNGVVEVGTELTPEAVSYTHLDVYKRQETDPCPEHQAGRLHDAMHAAIDIGESRRRIDRFDCGSHLGFLPFVIHVAQIHDGLSLIHI